MIFSEFQKRVITALVLLPIIFFVVAFSQFLFILFLIIVLILSFYEWFNLNHKIFSIITVLGFFIIILAIYFAYLLRGNNIQNITLFLWVVLVSVFSDIGGYSFGKLIGGKKITKISPKKTYAGMLGSFIFSTFPILFLYFLNYKFILLNSLFLSWKTIILSLLFSLVSQLGDIAVSYYKRKRGVKDTGKLLPGHGGLLDRIDGLIFVIIFSGTLKIFGVI